eukprot:gene23763-26893_t
MASRRSRKLPAATDASGVNVNADHANEFDDFHDDAGSDEDDRDKGRKKRGYGEQSSSSSFSSSISRTEDKIMRECRKVINAQPAVLVFPRGEYPQSTKWGGRVTGVTHGPNPHILPFVGRTETVTSMVTGLIDNLDLAQRVYDGAYNVQKALILVGSGEPFGAGKTTVGPVVRECLQSLAPADQKVVSATVNIKPSTTPFAIWTMICGKPQKPELAELATQIRKDMSLEELLDVTERHLAKNDLILFLHLDAFRPFGDRGDATDERDFFCRCWKDTLMPILSTPRICLYISGRMAYFETLGNDKYQSPCQVLSAQLELFSPAIMCKVMNKMAIPAVDESSGDGGVSVLSDLLNTLPPATAGLNGAEDIARRLHNVTGGVPRFVEYAVNALLNDCTFGPALFQKQNLEGINSAVLDQIFGPKGSVYTAVLEAAESHFTGLDLRLCEGRSKTFQAEHVAGLIMLLQLRGQKIKLSRGEVKSLRSGKSSEYHNPFLVRLLAEAHFWGIHRSVELSDQGDGVLTFAVSQPMIDALVSQLRGLACLDKAGESTSDECGSKDTSTEAWRLRAAAGLVANGSLVEVLDDKQVEGLFGTQVGTKSVHTKDLLLGAAGEAPQISCTE